MYQRLRTISTVLLCTTLLFAHAHAETETDRKVNEFMVKNQHKFIYGPAVAQLGDQGSIRLQYGQGFVQEEYIKQIMKISGTDGDDVLGMVVPGLPGDAVPTDDWGTVFIVSKKIGFIKDDDANKWNPDQLLSSIRTSIEEGNSKRKTKGSPEQEIVGWISPPFYQASKHQLMWSLRMQEKGRPDTAFAYYTSVLFGREGFLIFVYISPFKDVAKRKSLAKDMLDNISYVPGKRYEDYLAGSDKIAEIGMAALIGGAVAKKLGLFAIIAALLLKWGKILLLGGAAVLAYFKFRK